MIPKPPKNFLIDSFGYKEYLGQGDYNKPKFGEIKTVNFCRIDRSPQYTATTSGKQLLYNAVVFCYEGLTDVMEPFKEQDIVIYDGQEHTITKAIPIYEPYANKLYSYELEVV